MSVFSLPNSNMFNYLRIKNRKGWKAWPHGHAYRGDFSHTHTAPPRQSRYAHDVHDSTHTAKRKEQDKCVCVIITEKFSLTDRVTHTFFGTRHWHNGWFPPYIHFWGDMCVRDLRVCVLFFSFLLTRCVRECVLRRNPWNNSHTCGAFHRPENSGLNRIETSSSFPSSLPFSGLRTAATLMPSAKKAETKPRILPSGFSFFFFAFKYILLLPL